MKQKGVAPILAIIIIVGILSLAGGGTAFYKYLTSPERFLASEEKKVMESVKEELADIEQALESLQDGDGKTIPEEKEETLARLRNETQERANAILKKDPCQITENDIREALQAAQDARLLGMEDVSGQLLDWVKDGVRSMAASASSGWERTWVERFFAGEIDPESVGHPEIEEGLKQSEPTLRDRLHHAQLARLFGLEDVYNAIIKGDYSSLEEWLNDNCKEGFTARLHSKDSKMLEGGIKARWETTVDLYTCSEDVLNADWTGTWHWNWEFDIPEVGEGQKSESIQIQFTSFGGQAALTIETLPATVSVNPTGMTMKFEIVNLGTTVASGKVTKGADQCNHLISN